MHRRTQNELSRVEFFCAVQIQNEQHVIVEEMFKSNSVQIDRPAIENRKVYLSGHIDHLAPKNESANCRLPHTR